jgi:drug/metabolite transporter (DMT)-like permease
MLAGILYLGSGLGLAILRTFRRENSAPFPRSDLPWLAAAILCGGVAGPVMLMWGLARMPAAEVSMLLNAEGVFTALLAWFVFRENFDRRIAIGMFLIVAGALVLSWRGEARFDSIVPALAVMGACLAWAVDNNLTRKVALADATTIAMLKGVCAGAVNVALAFMAGATLPAPSVVAAAGTLGFFSYGISLVLFVIALRHLGTARTGAYFSTAPFAGALLSIVLLSEPVTWQLAVAALLMGWGVWLHLTEHHSHWHQHEPMEHEHEHVHDVHHRHSHDATMPPGASHVHRHRHEPIGHEHEHFPDSHHRHDPMD